MLTILNSIVQKIYPKTFILCYHRVIPESDVKDQLVHRALYVTPEVFEKHILWMKRNGYFISSNDVFKSENHNRFMITFDDGWKDTFQYAFPILKKYSVPATVFVSTENIDKGILFWSEKLCFLVGKAFKRIELGKILSILKYYCKQIIDKKNIINITFSKNYNDLSYLLDRIIECLKLQSDDYRSEVLELIYKELNVIDALDKNLLLSWDDIASMVKDDRITIGSHTNTHVLLDRVSDQKIDNELYLSKRKVEEKTGREVKSFAYPNGYYNKKYLPESLKKNGYEYAFTLNGIVEFPCDPLLIPRCLIFQDISNSFEKYYLKKLIKTLLNQKNIEGL